MSIRKEYLSLYSREWLKGYPRVGLGWLKDLIWHMTYREKESRDENGLEGERRDCQEAASFAYFKLFLNINLPTFGG